MKKQNEKHSRMIKNGKVKKKKSGKVAKRLQNNVMVLLRFTDHCLFKPVIQDCWTTPAYRGSGILPG